jgi:hypothetical protein
MEQRAMTDGEIVNFWGADNLKRWAETNLHNVKIPESSKRFLVTVGLPYKQKWHFRLDAEADELPSLPKKKNLRRICFYGHSACICLDEKLGGSVVWVSTPDASGESLVNTDVERFGRFLVLFGEYVRKGATISKKDFMDYVETVVPTIQDKMRKIDPKALEDEEGFWSVIIEQMEDGLL